MTKQQFILDTLLPYFKDITTCAANENGDQCFYQMDDGRRCAMGKHLTDEGIEFAMVECDGEGAQDINYKLQDEDRTLNDILTPEAATMNLTVNEWGCIQVTHDALTRVGWLDREAEIRCKITYLENEAGVDLTELKQLI